MMLLFFVLVLGIVMLLVLSLWRPIFCPSLFYGTCSVLEIRLFLSFLYVPCNRSQENSAESDSFFMIRGT